MTAAVEGGQDGEHGVQRAADVAESVFQPQGAAAFVAHNAVQAGQGADGRGVGAQIPQRPLLSGGGYGRHYDVRLDGAQGIVAQPQAFHYARREVFDNHITAGGQAPGQRRRFRLGNVEGNAELAPVHIVEHWVLFRVGAVANDGAAHSHIVQPLAGFHLDDLGAQVGQYHPRDGAGQHPAEVQDAVSGQGAGAVRGGVGRRWGVVGGHWVPFPCDLSGRGGTIQAARAGIVASSAAAAMRV